MADPTREEIDAAKAKLLAARAPKPKTAEDIAADELQADALRAQAEECFALCAADPSHYTPGARAAIAAAGMQADPRAVALRESVKCHRVLVTPGTPGKVEPDPAGGFRVVTPAVPAVYEDISRAEMERRHAAAMADKRARVR